MSQGPPNSAPPENAPDKGEATQAEPKDVPELEAFDEDEFDTAFARLEEPNKS